MKLYPNEYLMCDLKGILTELRVFTLEVPRIDALLCIKIPQGITLLDLDDIVGRNAGDSLKIIADIKITAESWNNNGL